MTTKSKFNRVHFSSQKVTWNTPKELLVELDKEFHFNFDPCIPARFGHFTGNGLRAKWRPNKKTKGRVFCNPPYKKKITTWWVMKGWEQLVDDEAEFVVFLMPDRMGTDWATFMVEVGAEFRQIRGRLSFGDQKESAPFDSLLVIVTRKMAQDYIARVN